MESNDVRLETCIDEKNWDLLTNVLKPKLFARAENGKLVSPLLLAKIADTLTNPSVAAPPRVKIVLLKCLMNSCIDGYIPKSYETGESISTKGENEDFYKILYKRYADISAGDSTDEFGYPFLTHFPYDGVLKWAAEFVSRFSIEEEESFTEEDSELLRLSLQVLCNLCQASIPYLKNERFKKMILTLIRRDRIPLSRAACAFIHNALNLLEEDFYSDEEKNELTLLLVGPVRNGIRSAIDALKRLLREPKRLRNVYDKASTEDRLYLLETFLEDLRESRIDAENEEVASFLADRFKRRSDLVLKTVNSYMDGTEPMEITILLDILGVMTSRTSGDKNCANNFQQDKSLLINCIFLLKSLHMAGKGSENFFTPVQKLSELAPNEKNRETQKSDDIQSHPAFGFKAGLIRVIGNMVHKHRANQDLVRETDGIPLLLDCCNMDARNPLIMQWTILAMRNLCENNKENQDVVRGLNKVGIADSAVLHEMGMVLHDEGDGKAIGIVPLNKS